MKFMSTKRKLPMLIIALLGMVVPFALVSCSKESNTGRPAGVDAGDTVHVPAPKGGSANSGGGGGGAKPGAGGGG